MNQPKEVPAQPQELQRLPESRQNKEALPDHQRDPFRDEDSARVLRIPTQPVQYRLPPTNYGQNYDAQTRNSPVRVRVSDESIPDSTQLTLDPHRSSRLNTRQPQRQEQNATEVVTASVKLPQKIESVSNLRLVPSQLEESQPINPLRD